MRFLAALLSLSVLSSCSTDEISRIRTVQHLHNGWEFMQEGNDAWHPAQVPGVVHLDLLTNELIGDPFWEDNELNQRWIEEENWVYQNYFQVAEADLLNEHIELHFQGLDTYAKVYLNDKQILTADNMFRSWSSDVKPLLKLGDNHLRLVFESPIKHNLERVKNYPHSLPSGNEPDDIPVKVAAFTRKAAYHFGWDWAPRFVTAGIWRPVKLTSWNEARIQNVFTSTQSLDSSRAIMRTEVEIEVSTAGVYQLILNNHRIDKDLIVGLNQITHDFTVLEPKMWWTNGLGAPHLYRQEIKLLKTGNTIDTSSNMYGIRSIELVNEPDNIGTSFYFKLNGQPVFMKGANYIPQDVFLPRVGPEKYKELIESARDANINMLRVWGGGVYERDLFYELCDQNGIMVWQDFMFAGSLYPNDDAFQATVVAEVAEVVQRLRQHPCLAVWCGNNEVEVAWKNWGWQKQYGYSSQDSVEIWEQYRSLFQELIPQLVKQYQPEANYTSTTPLSNWGSPENFNHSSMHYWGVWHGKEPFENFESNVGRFMVEYGFQSFPSLATLQKVIGDSNLYWGSPMLDHRQKSYIGNGLIMNHIEQYYDEPKTFEQFIELSQTVQAKAMQMAISAHLKNQPHCMGSLFWQLNDCWPGPSWSVIDYYGEKKPAYDLVKQGFGTK